MGKFVATYRDFGQPGEVSTVTVPTTDITAANIVAQTAALDTLRQSMEKLMLGGLVSRSLVAWTNDTKTEASSPYAQRENKWLIRFHEDISNGPTHYLEIPTANLNYLDPTANDTINRTDSDVIDFIADFEAVVEVNGNAVVVDSIAFVARRT